MNSLQRYTNDPYLSSYALRTLQTMALPTASITEDQLRNLAKECLEYREFFAKAKQYMEAWSDDKPS